MSRARVISGLLFADFYVEDHNVFFAPSYVRTLNPLGYRPGEWARVLGVVRSAIFNRVCWVVEFADEARDTWVVGDPDGQYEFR